MTTPSCCEAICKMSVRAALTNNRSFQCLRVAVKTTPDGRKLCPYHARKWAYHKYDGQVQFVDPKKAEGLISTSKFYHNYQL